MYVTWHRSDDRSLSSRVTCSLGLKPSFTEEMCTAGPETLALEAGPPVLPAVGAAEVVLVPAVVPVVLHAPTSGA